MIRQTFHRQFEVEVPARSPIGSSPSREHIFSFTLPNGFGVIREGGNYGARVIHINFGGLTERRREFRSIENGIELVWKLSNGEVFPVTGRKAFINIELTGESLDSMSLSDKYKTFRNRFFSDFFFEGLVAEYIDLSIPGGKIKFADQTIYLGQALLAMATEGAILQVIGSDTTDTKNRIKVMLNVINRLDEAADAYFAVPVTLDGFFIRDDVSGSDDPRLGNRFVECESDFQNPERENASPSGDQILGMMFGLSAVVILIDDSDITLQAREISSRLYDYARRNRFVLRLPNEKPTRRGSDMRWLSSLLHGLNKDITEQDLFNESEIELLGGGLPLTGIASFWDDPITAQLISDLAGREFRIPIINEDIELNSFALHIILMAIAPSDVWSQSEVERLAIKVQHHLSVLLYCLRHPGTLPEKFERNEIKGILDACPETGPAASLPPSTGWNKDNRWIRSGNLGEPSTGGNEKYNGLDWMILHNLNQLIFIGG